MLIAAACFAWTYAQAGIVYYINDDVGMQRIASGSMTGVPDSHLVYIKYALGLVISGLYRAEAHIDWYGLTMLGFMYACLVLILIRALHLTRTLARQIIVVTLIMVGYVFVGLPAVAQFQFTTVAGWLSGTAIFWLYTSASGSHPRRFVEDAACFVLLVSSYVVRSNVFLMSLPFATVAFVSRYRNAHNRTAFSILLPALVLISVGAVQIVEQDAYGNRAWKDYLAFDALEIRIYDYCGLPAYGDHQAFYRSIGVSHATYNLLLHWTFVPNSSANGQTFHAIAAKCDEIRAAALGSTTVFSQSYGLTHEVLSVMLARQHAVLNLALLVFLTVAVANAKAGASRVDAFVILASIVVFVAEWFYLVYNGRFPERVIWVVYCMAVLFLAAVALPNRRPILVGGDVFVRLVVGLATVILLGAAVIYQTRIVKKEVQAQAVTNGECAKVMTYIADHPGNFYFLSTLSFADCTQTFSVGVNAQPSNFTFMGGWDFFSPLLRSNWSRYGIRDVSQDLLNRNDILVLDRPPESIEYIVDFYRSIGVNAVANEVGVVESVGGSRNSTVFNLKVVEDPSP